MEIVTIRPEQELKKLFFIYMTPVFLPVLVLILVVIFVPLDFPATLIVPGIAVFFLLMAALIALWIPAFYRSLEYIIDGDAIRSNSGVFWKRRVTVPYTKVTNVDILQGPVQRMYGVGSVHVQTAGASAAQGGLAELSFLGIRDLEGVRDAIMSRVKGNAASVPSVPAVPASAEKADSPDVQQGILAELKAIRAALEQRRS